MTTLTEIDCPMCGARSTNDTAKNDPRGVYFCTKCIYAHRGRA